jgi:hypothetical protein
MAPRPPADDPETGAAGPYLRHRGAIRPVNSANSRARLTDQHPGQFLLNWGHAIAGLVGRPLHLVDRLVDALLAGLGPGVPTGGDGRSPMTRIEVDAGSRVVPLH